MPDGTSGIFFAKGLDRISDNRHVGQISWGKSLQISQIDASEPDLRQLLLVVWNRDRDERVSIAIGVCVWNLLLSKPIPEHHGELPAERNSHQSLIHLQIS